MEKTYEINDDSKKNKRLKKDFNLYGCNLNISKKPEIDDMVKYGRVN